MKMDTIQPSQATIDACDPVEQLYVDTHKRDQDGLNNLEYPFNIANSWRFFLKRGNRFGKVVDKTSSSCQRKIAVLKAEGATTECRVVFDGPCKISPDIF